MLQQRGNQQQGNAESAEKTNNLAPSISLPKGGGAIRGIGEKFAANPVTGTGSLSVPIATSPGRSGFGPQLSLSYDSGAGNGPFGFGWNLSLPSITRKTDKGVPKYQDAEESDVFILSGAEDLVPVLKKQGDDWVPEDVPDRAIGTDTYRIKRYRPRIEGLFARIERWTNIQTNETHWRSISRDNITTVYGQTTDSRIEDPNASEGSPHIFSWFICESYDDKGNAITYEYEPEDSTEIDLVQTNERNRTDNSRSANCYLKRIKYGNKTPVRHDSDLPREFREDLSARTDWLFEVVFDYDEGHYEELPADPNAHQFVNAHKNPTQDWQRRQDPFSSYRSGFEVRTYRLCHRVLMFHHFPDELGVDDYLVRSTGFKYKEGPIASFITSVTQSGFKRQENGTYLKKSLPPLEFEYSEATIQDKVEYVDKKYIENLPRGLDGAQYQWVDLDGEGISGILTEQADTWFYKRNLSPVTFVNEDGKQKHVAAFAPLENVASQPSLANLRGGQQQLLDLAGDGQLDLVALSETTPGFFERTHDQQWESFKPFISLPNLNWNDPNLRFVDLNGDGHADIFITEDAVFTWYPSLAEEGFGQAEKTYQSLDEEQGPRLVFADGTQSIYLADLSGDGLSDLVRIRNGEVCYWPNLGYGHFGTRVTMDDSPWFDLPDLFDQRRIRLADIDGSGTTDIIYLGSNAISLWRNQSGNSWSPPYHLTSFPKTDNLSSVTVVDLLGNGTACLVWSSPLPKHVRKPMRYIDLMGGQKPHLLVKTKNNLGAETHIHYVPSTKFYLADKEAGTPWITRIPFPVHVVERVETYDHISRNRFVTRYAYHHGYFDGIEREFRGFGMVEQWDTEEYAALSQSHDFPTGDNIEASSHVPPVLTKTWFHTGVHIRGAQISLQFKNEYYREPGLADDQIDTLLLPDTILPPNLFPEEERLACRALKGVILRQELYGLDSSTKADHPYTVSERNYTIKTLQPIKDGQDAVFLVHPRETIDYHYERNPANPRVIHQLTLEVDEFGNVRKSAKVGYGRRQPDPELFAQDQAKQAQTLITCTDNAFTNSIDTEDDYRTPLPCDMRTYELTGLSGSSSIRFSLADVLSAVDTADAIDYEVSPDSTLQKRLIEHVRILYRKDDLTGPLPLGQLEPMALLFESYKLALTQELILQVYGNRITDAILSDEGGYIHSDGDDNWWISSGQIFYSPNASHTAAQELVFAQQNFFMPHRFQDPFGNNSIITYDKYTLLLQKTTDPLGNVVTVVTKDDFGNELIALDYRVLQPWLVTDPNGNRSVVAFDALGLVVGTAIMGKVGENVGDSLADFEPDLNETTILTHLQNPLADSHAILQRATTRLVYDMFAYQRTQTDSQPQPSVIHVLARETHDATLAPEELTKIQYRFSYFDGFGREIQKKAQAEAGDIDGEPTDPRWVCSGWTIFNNKGKPIKKYEPFFSVTHHFEFAKTVGVSSTLFYDPLGRVIATLHPNHTYEKAVFDSWWQKTWDVNDTVLQNDPRTDLDVGDFFCRLPDTEFLPSWHAQRITGALGTNEQKAATKSAAHADTPGVVYLDAIGRTFLSIADNGDAGKYSTRIELDIENNQRTILDARERTFIQYDYDMLENRIRQDSMDGGTRWILSDVDGKPIYGWDSRGHTIHTNYDNLQRPTEVFMHEGTGAEKLVECTVYGEAQGDAHNHRGRIYQQFNSTGVTTYESYDFKGNLIRGSQRLATNYKNTLDWSTSVALEAETFTTETTYDALNRPVTLTMPDNSVIYSAYNKASLLDHIEASLRGGDTNTVFVNNIDYNVKGQRELIEYGNGVRTSYKYDDLTLRLIRLQTRRDAELLQDLSYTFDPVGNITSIRDDAQQTIYFNNTVVEPHSEYIYDALYRLIESTGREHIGQVSQPQTTWDEKFRINLPHPNDGQAMQRYTERYEYDEVGNILHFVHQVNHSNWSRTYTYDEASPMETGKKNNRLSSTMTNAVTEHYTHDIHGNLTSMPHLAQMVWDFKDQLCMVDLDGGGKAYYVYNAGGQRVRKVIERQNGTRKEERLYLGGFEIYCKYKGDGNTVELERESLHIMDAAHRVSLVETRTQGDDGSPTQLVRYQLGNHLGSASLELDDMGQIISYEEYYPFGSTSYQAVRTDIEVPLKLYRFNGMERDNESGMYYYGARYYVPWLTRWVSIDPQFGRQKHQSPYVGLRNNPLYFIDPNGGCETAYTCYLTRQFSTPEGAERTLEAHRQIGEAALRALAQPRVVGALQTVGGTLEILGGAGAAVVPEPATTAAGVVLIVHGSDTLSTGLHTLWTGEVQHTFTQQAGAATAEALGASPETSQMIGTGVDIAAGVGPSIFISVSRRLPVVAAEEASSGAQRLVIHSGEQAAEHGVPSVSLGYLHRGSTEVGELGSAALGVRVAEGSGSGVTMGHNVVGITTESGTQWFHLVGAPGQEVRFIPYTQGGRAVAPTVSATGSFAEDAYVITTIPVSASRAQSALRTATEVLPRQVAGQTWRVMGPNCTTTTLQVLQDAGVAAPAWAQSPMLLHLGVNYGYEVTAVTSGAASMAPTVVEPSPERR